MFSSFSTRPCPCLCFLTVSIRSLYSNSVASGKGSKNSHLVKISGGGTPETRFVSSFALLFFVTSGSLTRGPPSIAEGDAPGITSRVKGNDLAGCKQNSIHWWTNGDGPRARPPSASASLPESGIAGIAFGKKKTMMLHWLVSRYVIWYLAQECLPIDQPIRWHRTWEQSL